MGYVVNSASVDLLREQSPTLFRFLTIGGSDYSDRVMGWPALSWDYDEIRPKGFKLELTNADDALGFFRDDKTKMEAEVAIGVDLITSTEQATLVSSYAGTTDVYSYSPTTEDPLGSFVVTSGGASYVIARTGPSETVEKYAPIASYQLNGMVGTYKKGIGADDLSIAGVAMTLSGNKIFVPGDANNRLLEYTPTVPYVPDSMTLTNTFDLAIDSLDLPRGIEVNSDASKMWFCDRRYSHIWEYSLPTPGSVAVMSLTATFSAWPDVLTGVEMRGLAFNDDFSQLLVAGNDEKVHALTLPTPGSIIGMSFSSDFLDVSSAVADLYGISVPKDSPDYMYLVDQGPDSKIVKFQNSLEPAAVTSDRLTLFKGTTRQLGYRNELCTINVKDRFTQLSDRKVGAPDVPVAYTGSNHLGSDLAWYIVTSHAGLDATKSSANTDIDYAAFEAWSEVFSSDQIRMQASFDGQSCTEALRKILRLSQSTAYVREGLLTIKRIGVAEVTVDSYADKQLFDLGLAFQTDDITNRQLIAGNYDATSGFQFTITQQNTASVNSFGAREDILRDEAVWYVDSATAINHAQRMLILNADPNDKLTAKSGTRGWIRTVGETVSVVDSFHGINDNYLVRGLTVDLDDGSTNLSLDKILLKKPFRMDVSTLDNTEEVLT